MPQFVTFIMLKIRYRNCLKIEKQRFLLIAQRLAKTAEGMTTFSNNFLTENIVND